MTYTLLSAPKGEMPERYREGLTAAEAKRQLRMHLAAGKSARLQTEDEDALWYFDPDEVPDDPPAPPVVTAQGLEIVDNAIGRYEGFIREVEEQGGDAREEYALRTAVRALKDVRAALETGTQV